jgi:hypothetical protein
MRWTEARLQRLFRYYNTCYWQGRVPEYRVVPRHLRRGTLGLYQPKAKTILIDVQRIRAHFRGGVDRRVKQTLIHEMAHVASNGDHAGRFFEQLIELALQSCQLAGDEILCCTENVTSAKLNEMLRECGYRRKRRKAAGEGH